jgi:peptide/nickel transport system substrate-binding protein
MTASRHRWRSLALVVAMFGLMTAGITAPAASADDTGTTLSVVADTQIKTFNPFLSYYDGELDILGMIYPTLSVIDKNGQPGPYLADSWTTSADKLTWTFKIHSGLKWSDGQPLTAKDAAWTFNLIMTNDDAATANGSLVSNFASVTAPDDTTLVIKTKAPQANMAYISIPVSGIPIVPQHIWESKVAGLKDFTNMQFPVVGYGPYTLVGNVTNQYATLQANKSFFLGAPKYDTLISRYFANSDAAVAALKNGELTQISGLTAAQFTALQNTSNIQTYQQQANGWTAIEVNSGAKTRTGKPFGTGNPLLADKTVRQAIALAIDRQQLVTKILDGHGVAGSSYIPPAYAAWKWSPTTDQALTYNPAKANQILDAAGYKMGADGIRVDSKTGKPLVFRYGIHSDEATDAQVAPYIQEWLKAVGIGATVQPMSFDQLNNNLAKGDWDMLMDGWSTGYDPTYLLSIQTCATLPKDDGTAGNTDAFFCDPAYDKLFDQQVTQFDTAQRASTIGQMQSILYAQNADIVLFYKNSLGALRTDKVSNYLYGSPDSNGFYPLQNLFYNWTEATPIASSGSSFPTWAIVAIIVGVVLVIGVVVIVLMRRRSTAAERE